MNDLEISYGVSFQRNLFALITGGYISLYGFYQCVLQALINTFTLNFYLALTAIVLGVILILGATLWKSKPLFRVNSESIYANLPEQKSIYVSEWISIKGVGVGIDFFKFSETDGKDYQVDLGYLKYNDIKKIKSRVIEFCESKNIPYRNI